MGVWGILAIFFSVGKTPPLDFCAVTCAKKTNFPAARWPTAVVALKFASPEPWPSSPPAGLSFYPARRKWPAVARAAAPPHTGGQADATSPVYSFCLFPCCARRSFFRHGRNAACRGTAVTAETFLRCRHAPVDWKKIEAVFPSDLYGAEGAGFNSYVRMGEGDITAMIPTCAGPNPLPKAELALPKPSPTAWARRRR